MSNDGKYLENFVKKEFEKLQKTSNYQFRYERLYDSTAAGKIVQAKVADFRFCNNSISGHLECKSTANKNFRLDKFPQLPRMKLWDNCGSLGILLVHFHVPDVLKITNTLYLSSSDASHDLSQAKTTSMENFLTDFLEVLCLSQTLYKAGLL